MLRKYASLIIAAMLVTLVATACIVRSHNSRRSQPVYVEKHKPQKHKDHGKHKGRKH